MSIGSILLIYVLLMNIVITAKLAELERMKDMHLRLNWHHFLIVFSQELDVEEYSIVAELMNYGIAFALLGSLIGMLNILPEGYRWQAFLWVGWTCFAVNHSFPNGFWKWDKNLICDFDEKCFWPSFLHQV